jgi:hypothetical protein|tara:strand:- start:509 stop:979 length:471 start_codon:yes stop_codon:yes gene_type:complete
MSNIGVRGYYLVTTTIKDNLINDENVNTITTGDITKIDLAKQTIFPLSHIIVNNVSQEEQVLRFNVSVICMDVVNQSKDETTDLFIGNNNEQDILNTQLAVVNKLIELLRSGSLYTNKYQLDGVVGCEPFFDRFESEVAGWVATMDILIDNDINIC